MINAVSTTSAASPAGAAARPAGQEPAVRAAAPAPAPAVHVAPVVSHEESTVVTISAQAARSAQIAQAGATTSDGKAAATTDGRTHKGAHGANATTERHATSSPTPAPAPQIRATYIAPAPGPLSLDPIPSQHLPALAFDPADVNQDGQVSASEQATYDFHHAPSLAAQPGESDAALSAYTSIAGS